MIITDVSITKPRLVEGSEYLVISLKRDTPDLTIFYDAFGVLLALPSNRRGGPIHFVAIPA